MPHAHKGDIEVLRNRLTNLSIYGGQTGSTFLAYTTEEPLFCIERDSQEELHRAVADTIVSYAKTFYNLEPVGVGLKSEEIPVVAPVPVERINPISRLRPNFDRIDSRSGFLATV